MNRLKSPQADSVLIDTWNDLSWPVYSYDLPDSAIYFSLKAIELAEKIQDTKRLSIAHRRLGIAYINLGDFKQSIRHQEISYELSEQIGFREGMRKALNNLGVIYLNNELLNKALAYFLKSIKLSEAEQDSSTLFSLYNNCGVIYMRLSDFEKSIQFYGKALQLSLHSANSDMFIDLYCNISASYRNLGQLDSSFHYLNKAEKLIGVSGNSKSKYSYYTAKGLLYSVSAQHDKALACFELARKVVTNKSDEITVLINLGEEVQKMGKTREAILYFTEAYKVSEAQQAYSNLKYLSKVLAELQEAQNNLPAMKRYIKAYLAYSDSNDKYVKVQSIRQQQLEFDFEKKQLADSLKFAQREAVKNMELAVAEAKLHREKNFRITLLLALVLVVILAVFLYNRFFVMRRQNLVIENQKQVVETKNREILDSINYAKRLQTAILPPLEEIRSELNCAILYQPRDIIGGDFYFFEKQDGILYFAVCDCTGHGIPGALMSVVCHQAMKKSILEFKLSDPAQILSKSRDIIIEQLRAKEHHIRDGMDVSLLAIDKKHKRFFWAGANNPLWIWDSKGFSELRGDKQPVAWHENATGFTVQKGDFDSDTRFCLFSDGYADQFGGEKGKKFKVKQLREKLETLRALRLEEQITALRTQFLDWKGPLDQVDDVSLALIAVEN
ncbi:MAG TPA: tetratricopeptide repeat protein [Bacteroidia bacterium]|nr:tetratricopeptide repeat protein [Bacteroidia bacterium]